ncbi:hypothetical protein AAG906_036985 [Vitis piasezkii]
MLIRRGARWRWQLRLQPSGGGPDEVPERPIRSKMLRPGSGRGVAFYRLIRGILLMMRLAPPLALLATRSWKRS